MPGARGEEECSSLYRLVPVFPLESFRMFPTDTFSTRTVNIWSAAWADTPPMNSSSVASTATSVQGVYRGIQRGTIVAAPTDQPALQAKVAVDLAIRILEKQDHLKHVSAPVLLVDRDNVSRFDVGSSLAPPGFRPLFSTTE
jgi:hypothetical protein